jgi:hypothetical protein
MTRTLIHMKMTTKPSAKQTLVRLRRFWSYWNAGPQQDWDRVYLCSVAPISAEALRGNEEAERAHMH